MPDCSSSAPSGDSVNQYQNLASYYDNLMLGGYYDYAAQSAELAELLAPNARVLEISVGTGLLAEALLNRGFRVTGVDHTEEMLVRARERLGNDVTLVQADVVTFDLGERFDATLLEGTFAVEMAGRTIELESHQMVFNPTGFGRNLAPLNDREGFEVAGAHGRQVLNGVLGHAHKWLKPRGRAITIATSLQGWHASEQLLAREWQSYQVLREIELELTDECGPPYIDWWLEQQANDGEERIYQQDGKWMHKLWYLEACK